MRLVLVRHGETAGQSSIRYHGASDVPLSDLGRTQMHRVAETLAGERFAAVYASALSRSWEGARIVSGADHLTVVSHFNEVNFGVWEGLTEEEIATQHPDQYRQWRAERAAHRDFRYPGGESTAEFRSRVLEGLRRVLIQAPAGALLLVLHKGVIRTILAELLALDAVARRRPAIELASIHILARQGAQWRAEVLDHVTHLETVSQTQTD
jgi:broad specificity phosphatase PhoE